MSSEIHDTQPSVSRAAKATLNEPDSAATLLRDTTAVTAVDPHMWPDEEPEAVVEPAPAAFYGFRVGSSAVVLLDAIAYIGRKPSVPRVVRGGRSRLVRVQSPTNEVSSTHVELRQLGSSVIVQDLRSTNGTRIGVPGLPVRRLRPDESAVITVGTLIDIGDRNIIEILPLQEPS